MTYCSSLLLPALVGFFRLDVDVDVCNIRLSQPSGELGVPGVMDEPPSHRFGQGSGLSCMTFAECSRQADEDRGQRAKRKRAVHP